MKKDLIFGTGLIGLIIGLLVFSYYSGAIPKIQKPASLSSTQVKIEGRVIKAEIARTAEQHAKGLSNRESLPEGSGMLFVFPKPDKYQFWMKNTKIPLDIIWIDQNKRIVDYYKAAQPQPGVPDAQLRLYGPSTAALYVLEVEADTIDKFQIVVGDKVEFSL